MEAIIYCDCQDCIYEAGGECQRWVIKVNHQGECLSKEVKE